MYDYTDNQQGAFRYEYFDDTDVAKGFGGSMYTLTYTHNVTIHENVLLRPEVRYNHYSIPSTPGADDPLSPGDKGNTADDEWIIGVGAEYVF
jgi:maltoporin